MIGGSSTVQIKPAYGRWLHLEGTDAFDAFNSLNRITLLLNVCKL